MHIVGVDILIIGPILGMHILIIGYAYTGDIPQDHDNRYYRVMNTYRDDYERHSQVVDARRKETVPFRPDTVSPEPFRWDRFARDPFRPGTVSPWSRFARGPFRPDRFDRTV